jgi:hypothetical protein
MSADPIPFPEGRIVRRHEDQDGAEVVLLPVATCHDIPVDRVLAGAAAAGLTHIMIVGYTEDGQEYFASSMASGPECLWLLERAKAEVMMPAPYDGGDE